jgi:hypothetical protein
MLLILKAGGIVQRAVNVWINRSTSAMTLTAEAA